MSPVLRFLTALMLLVLGSPRLACAQEVSATLGVPRTIRSTTLREDRKVFVHLPASYLKSGDTYPVLYLLDGTETFLLETYRYETYQDYPHVPFPCLYDGLRFVTTAQPKKPKK